MLQRRHGNSEGSLRDREGSLEQQLAEEARVSRRIESYLKKHYEELAEKVDHWMTRHEQDIDMKGRDLHELKVCVASGIVIIIVLCMCSKARQVVS